MHGRMDQDRLAVRLPQSPYRRLTAVRGAVVYDPKTLAGRPVGLGPHNLLDQAAKRVDPGFLLAPTHDSTTTNVPSGQVLQGSPSLVLMLHAHGTTRRGRKRRVTSDARLNARLLIRADDVVSVAQRFAVPGASVQVQDSPGFFGELRIAGEDPVLIPPGFDRVRVEDAPDGAGADRSAQGCRGLVGQVRSRKPTQWQFGLADGFTSDGLDDCPVARGKRRAWPRPA